MPKITNQLCLLGAINLKCISHLVALSSCFRIQAISNLSTWKFLLQLLKSEAYFRTQSTTLTTYLRYPINYFLHRRCWSGF